MAETKMRYIRIDEDLWRKAIVKARNEGTNLSTVIRDWLDGYVNDDVSVEVELKRNIQQLIVLHRRLKIGDE
jgi:hypothetical protein